MTTTRQPSELLTYFRLLPFRHTYVLGSFASRVTIYSQQVRALNLVDSIFHQEGEGLVPERTRILIVGAGVAGLTAAAAAARRGAEVVLLEKEPDVLTIQRHNTQRYLHPHIVDWPNAGWDNDDADLPVLSWTANTTKVVFDHMRGAWNSLLDELDPLITPRFDVNLTELLLSVESQRVQHHLVSWEDGLVGGSSQFDAVILAVGFGTERKGIDGATAYWDDDLIDKAHDQSGKRWLVSGSGDGGLTDLMRLCIKQFNHKEVLRAFSTLDEFVEPIKAMEEEARTNPEFDFLARYRTIFNGRERLIEDWFRESKIELRNDVGKVCLADTSPLMLKSNASPLNRFIVAALKQIDRFEFRQLATKTLPQRGADGRFTVPFSDNRSEQFDHIVQRHGVESPFAIPIFGDFSRNLKDLRDKWTDLARGDDFTKAVSFSGDRYARTKSGLRRSRWLQRVRVFDSFGVISTVLIQIPDGNATDSLLAQISEGMLAQDQRVQLQEVELRERFSRKPFLIDAAAVPLEERAVDSGAFARMLRLLCGATIAIFEITENDPAIAFLLGIRCVVRRGVTILATRQKSPTAVWNTLPFNIREMSFAFLRAAKRPQAQDELWTLIVNGIQGMKSRSDYTDAPAYRLIRQVEPDRARDPLVIETKDHTLLMCPYDFDDTQTEKQDRWDWLIDQSSTAIQNKLNKDGVRLDSDKGGVLRVIDLPSPELTSQILYKGLRRNELCIFDWSHWRANVFYELGVRCAATSKGSICLIEDDHTTGDLVPTKRWLLAQFRPMKYTPLKDQETFRKNLSTAVNEALRREKWTNDLKYQGPLSRSFIFDVVSQSISPDHEVPTLTPDERLFDLFRSVLNEDNTSDKRPPRILFSNNETLKELHERAALRELMAAYLYADETRLALGDKADPEFLKNYWRITDALKEHLDYYQQRDDLMKRILKRLDMAQS